MNNRICFSTIIFFFLSVILSFGNEITAPADQKKNEYLREKLSYSVKEEFDQRYPLNIKKFSFFRGNDKITYEDFLKTTNNSFLIKQNEKLKKIQIAGFSTVGVFGGCTIAFLVPSVIFIVKQTNYMPVDTAYTFSGTATVILTGVSFIGLIIGLCVTFYQLYQNKYSEYPIRKAAEDFNESLRQKLGIVPDLSVDEKNIKLELKLKL